MKLFLIKHILLSIIMVISLLPSITVTGRFSQARTINPPLAEANKIKASIKDIIYNRIPQEIDEITNDINASYQKAASSIQNEFSTSAERASNFFELSNNFETFTHNIISHFNQTTRQRVFNAIKTIHELFNQLNAPRTTSSIEENFSGQIRNDLNSYIEKLVQELNELKKAIVQGSGLSQKVIDELTGSLGSVQIEKERKDNWKTFVKNMQTIGTEFNKSSLNNLVDKTTSTVVKEVDRAVSDVKDKITNSVDQIIYEAIYGKKNY